MKGRRLLRSGQELLQARQTGGGVQSQGEVVSGDHGTALGRQMIGQGRVGP